MDLVADTITDLAKARDEIAELRGDVMALWMRLGDMLVLLRRQGGFQSAEDQIKIRNARELHALWKTEG